MLLTNKLCLEHLRSRTFILDLWYWQHCNVIVEITDNRYNMQISFKTLQRTQEHGGYTEPLGNDTFVEKVMSSSYHMEQKTFTEAVY